MRTGLDDGPYLPGRGPRKKKSDWRLQFPVGSRVGIRGTNPWAGKAGIVECHETFLGVSSIRVGFDNGGAAGVLKRTDLIVLKGGQRMTRKQDYPADLIRQCEMLGLPAPQPEHRFCARRWRFDLAWRDAMLAVEVEGGLWIRGRHNRPMGYMRDMEKYNTAANMGWRVMRFTPRQVKNWDAIHVIAQALGVEVEIG